MIYGFDTSDEAAATGALLVYAIYRSRDRHRYKITPDMWAQIERFAKDAAKRARSLPAFIETLKPRLSCGAIHPRWMAIGETPTDVPMIAITKPNGSVAAFVQPPAAVERREFLTALIERSDARAVVRVIYDHTAWVVLLVRDRLEREKPLEAMLERLDAEEDGDEQLSA